jgi:hypothetical protein
MRYSHSPVLRHLNLVLVATAAVILGFSCFPAKAQVLFDNTKAEMAGNADWIIDTHQPIPSPSITTITASSPETTWTGALSSWGIALAKLRNSGQITLGGNGLETLPSGGRITYGDNSNSQDLSHYQVYVVCEPNILFTASEKTAILTFVQNGGGLFMVADHTRSDRNNDGSDSLTVWNDLFNNNSVKTAPFGFTFNADDQTPTATVDTSASDPIIHGIGGTVTTLKYDQGCTMSITDASICHAAVWNLNPTEVMALYGTFGAGRFVAIGDSSVTEDATSSSGTTYNGWTTPNDNGYCAINGTVWLLGTNSASTNTPPSVTTGSAASIGTNAATLNATVNPDGQNTSVRFLYGLGTNYNFSTNLTGVLSGTTAQAVSATIGGLTPGTIYHFAAAATNLSGSVTGLDQTFSTATLVLSAPAVTTVNASGVTTNSATLNGTVNPNNQNTTVQFLYGLTTNYTFVTNLPVVLSGGSPQSVSAAISGLTPATTYHFALSATNNSGSITGLDLTFTTANTNSGGGGGTNFTGILAGWDVSGSTNFGASPLPPSSNAPNISVIGLTRGSGLTTVPTAASRGWGANGWSQSSAAAGITANQFATFALTLTNGSAMSISGISRFDYRRSGSGPTNGLLQYQLGAGAFTDIATVTYSNSASSGASLGAIDLSGISALQNISAGTTVTFRLVNYNATGSGGTWYVFDVANSTALDFSISGSVTYPAQGPALAPIQAWRQQYFGTTNNSGTAADTYVASSDGMPNLLKYALGLNPLVAATNPITGDISTGFLRLTVPRNTNATDITYLVESAGDVITGWNTNATMIDQNTPAFLKAHDTNAVPATSRRFIRLHVTDP